MSAGLLMALSPALSEGVDDYQCGKGEDVRRIEIRFQDEANQLPCRVIYRPETTDDSVGTVSWRGINKIEECQSQARQIVDRLAAEGWTCAILSPSPGSEKADVIEAALDSNPADLETEEVPTSADNSAASEDLDDLAEEPAVLIDNPTLKTPSSDLKALIEEDLSKLDATLDGTLQAQIAAYSDLNADEIDDVLVLFTYISPQPAYRQFLAAYLFDGETYQLTATKPIASSSMDTKNAQVLDIDQGIIHVALEALQPGDDSCCPSGVKQIVLALRNLELVEIDQSPPTR